MSSQDPPPFPHTPGFTLTAHPNPAWKYGQRVDATPEGKKWVEGAEAGWTTIDAENEDLKKLYSLLLGGIAPRPVAFVSTVSESGVENLAPFSWFNQVSPSPPILSISCSSNPGGLKDTARNIKVTKGFTVNIISEAWVEQANMCSIDAPADVGEWPVSGLTKEPSTYVKAPRVKESAFSMECELLQAIDIVEPKTQVVTTTLILGTIKYIHIRNDVLDERGYIDIAKLKPVARLGGLLYARITEAFRIPRPVWQDTGKAIESALEGNDATL